MGQKRVLLVDDEADILDIMEGILEPLNVIIEKANDGAKGLELATAQSFDLIISDLNMPKMDGLLFLEKLRAAQIQTPIIFVTGYGDRQKVYKAWKLGASDFLDKPFKEEVYLQAVKAVLAYSESQNHIATISISQKSLDMAQQKAQAQQKKLTDFIEELITKA